MNFTPRLWHPSAGSCVVWILLPQYLMNGLSNLVETFRKYSSAPTDDLIRFWRSKVKVTAGRGGGKGIHFNVGGVEFHLLVFLKVYYHVVSA